MSTVKLMEKQVLHQVHKLSAEVWISHHMRNSLLAWNKSLLIMRLEPTKSKLLLKLLALIELKIVTKKYVLLLKFCNWPFFYFFYSQFHQIQFIISLEPMFLLTQIKNICLTQPNNKHIWIKLQTSKLNNVLKIWDPLLMHSSALKELNQVKKFYHLANQFQDIVAWIEESRPITSSVWLMLKQEEWPEKVLIKSNRKRARLWEKQVNGFQSIREKEMDSEEKIYVEPKWVSYLK